MTKAGELKAQLQPGQVYRRNDLEKWSTAVDRHLQELQEDGTLQKVAAGMYYYPKQTSFGSAPPSDEVLIRSYLKDDRFLVTSPNDYNKLGVGTTQLYNKVVVCNHKRHGDVKLGKRVFTFHRKPYFPDKVTPEFLLVDLVNNLNQVAEDESAVLSRVEKKVSDMDPVQLDRMVKDYGTVKTKKFFASLLTPA
jgi:hypothetical protein